MILEVLDPAAAEAFYDRFGSKQDAQGFYEKPALDELVTHARFDEAAAVFEFGCGTGTLAERLLRESLPATAQYQGCDISSTMVGLARDRLEPYRERAEVFQSDGSISIPLASNHADRILSTYVLDLMPKPEIRSFLSEARRVLAADGKLCLAGLTEGVSPLSRMTALFWRAVHSVRPSLVGGCRPLRLDRLLSPPDWHIEHHAVVVAWGIPSEVLIARPVKP
jgi:ubiquinone/menaquinone biosynthesis C-methylase UbiE